jgi:hypothetical protein
MTIEKPTPKTVIMARRAACLTQSQAAAVVYRTLRNWQQWESDDPVNGRAMDRALFEFFCLKTGINCRLCGYQFGDDWLDDGETCPQCRLVQ